ncbi:ABC transporter permease [Poseidonocella sedimentorum]|uniref:Phospholipid/cholesterol/gamma-HCH transport system permease protein n=1 Tax=Poseidonocella sedimentorum TaxID=871652 RepID=A0A1I6E8C1_9RHOB|nr:ABC transporter permease [Poseidonocella sedimentorum]SFR13966.1 phospholipid/cholesterol/gamma-HCH transport system permease protein [Poseidonocella sedimentorum]
MGSIADTTAEAHAARRDDPADAAFSSREVDGALCLRGAATLSNLAELQAALQSGARRIDLSDLSRLDSAGAWALATYRRRVEGAELIGLKPPHADIFETVDTALAPPEDDPAPRRSMADRLEGIGRAVVGSARTGGELIAYLGIFLQRLAVSIRHPSRFHLTALVHHCQEVGLKAVPIVALMAFLIGIVLAFQGSTQLRQFGAEVFVVDLIAISVLRELGILLTAIIVAGRTASSYTAAIGSMKMREEVDAMRALGVDPAHALIVPRILALLLMLPILGLIANVSGLIGGMFMSWIELGISPAMFRTRLVEGTDISHVFVGLVKAPFFALIIGIVGCHAGMQVKGNAESLGMMTSRAVVAAIFMVIVADALFSIFFAELGI